jgi:hypothetical protein
MENPQGATIKISKELRQKLKILVARRGFSTYDQLIREMIKKEENESN